MIVNITDGANATVANAWIHASTSNTGSISSTIAVEDAFRTTANVGITLILG